MDEEGSKVMRHWRQSGLSLGKFARKRGWDEQRLRYWRRATKSASSAR
jgi:hypothetical protein